MYVHIGKDVVVKTENIIGIFDIEKLEKKNSLENRSKAIGTIIIEIIFNILSIARLSCDFLEISFLASSVIL